MRNRILILLALAALNAPLQVANAQASQALIRETYNAKGKPAISLEVTPLLTQLPSSGYFPLRVKITNDSKASRTWMFGFTSRDFNPGGEGNELKSEFSVKCDSQAVAEVDLLVPLISVFLEKGSIELDIEVSAPPPFPGSRETISTESHHDWPSVMCSETIHSRNGNKLDKAAESSLGAYPGSAPHSGVFTGSGGYVGMGLEFGASFNPKSMPDDWRAYSGYDACLLTDGDWNDLPVGARSALRKWNRLGGVLLVYTTNPATDLNSLGLEKGAVGASRADFGWGTVRLQSFPDSGVLEAEETVKLVRDTISHTGGHRARNLRSNFHPHWPLQVAFGEKTFHIAFFILVLIIFGILVGPVNLFVFARAGHRHKLFVTTPLISLGASTILVVLILFQDGFGGRGQRLVLHEVGPDNTAYISQEQIARTGVLLKTDFTTSEHGYLSPVILANSRWARITEENSGGNSRYNVALDESGLKVTGDWFQSRSEHGHLFETIRPSRGRLNLVRSPAAPTINSTFEFPLDEIFYRDGNGGIWRGSDVQQGRNVSLTPSDKQEFADWFRQQQDRFARRNRARLDLCRNRRGHFFAVSTRAEGVSTLKTLNCEDTNTFLTGQVPTGN